MPAACARCGSRIRPVRSAHRRGASSNTARSRRSTSARRRARDRRRSCDMVMPSVIGIVLTFFTKRSFWRKRVHAVRNAAQLHRAAIHVAARYRFLSDRSQRRRRLHQAGADPAQPVPCESATPVGAAMKITRPTSGRCRKMNDSVKSLAALRRKVLCPGGCQTSSAKACRRCR